MGEVLEEEISLREILQTLWDGKWIIVGVTALLVALAGIYSFFIATPTYEAKGTVIINNTELPIGSLSEYANNATSRDVVVEVMQSPEVLQSTIDELNLDTTVSSLQSNIGVSKPEENESLINITYSGAERDIISNVIATVINQTKSHIDESLTNYIGNYEELYQNKITEQEESLNEFLEEYNALEEASGLPLLVLFEQNASGSQYMLEANEELLQELRELEKITQVEYEQINAKITQANDKYKQYYSKYEDALTANTINIIEERISTLSEPYAGANPVSPNKVLNVAIALVLGLMISVFVVFIMAYWKNTETRGEN